jgi:hypothetical protein
MRLPNYLVTPFVEFLHSLELPFRQSRLRTKMIKVAQKQLREIEEGRQELLEKYGDKDKEGQLVKEKLEDGTSRIPMSEESAKGFQKDYRELMQEDWILDENESNKDMLLAIKDIILNYDGVVQGELATQLDMFAEVFENLSYEQDK